ncbi:hypothetical protein D3C71_1413780 [compost metagenome]
MGGHRHHPGRQAARGAHRRRRAPGRRHAVGAAGWSAPGAGQPALSGGAARDARRMAHQGMDHDQPRGQGRLRRGERAVEHHGWRRQHQADAVPLPGAATLGPLRHGLRHHQPDGGHAAHRYRGRPESRRRLVQPGNPAGRAVAGRRRESHPRRRGRRHGIHAAANQHEPEVRHGAALLHHGHGAGRRPARFHPDPAE